MTVTADAPFSLPLDMPEPALPLMVSLEQRARALGGTLSAANMDSACSVLEAGRETARGLPLSWTLLILVLVLWSLWAVTQRVREVWARLTAKLQKLCDQNELLLHRMNGLAEITERVMREHQGAVLCEPASFLLPVMTEKWKKAKEELKQYVRLLGLEVEEMKRTLMDVIKVQALIRKSLVPLTADIPMELKEIRQHVEMIREGLEGDTQALCGAIQGLEERLQRYRQEAKSPPASTGPTTKDLLAHLAQIRVELRQIHASTPGAGPPLDPPPWLG